MTRRRPPNGLPLRHLPKPGGPGLIGKLRPKVLPGEDTKAGVSHAYLLEVAEKDTGAVLSVAVGDSPVSLWRWSMARIRAARLCQEKGLVT
jgi:hypothetical protein